MSEEVEVTARQELEEIAEVLREADEAEKAAKSLKDEVKGPFFDLISEVVRDELVLSRETVVVEADDEFDVREWQALNYPLHRVVGLGPGPEEGTLAITLEESDAFKKFEFTVNGFKFGRTVRMEGKGFNAEAFYNEVEDEELKDLVTVELVPTYSFNEKKAMKIMADRPETVATFQKYIVPGTPKVALLPIKPVKEVEEE